MTEKAMKRRAQIPDFAGTALVDILANGLAMLIIVIVLSIAARGEHEQRTASQVEEVETMMSRKFSTSLILNRLAASPPAQLHDYRNSPLDQQHDPYLLPIIELHQNFVREYYTGTVWSREQLLREPNAMDEWLSSFDPDRKRRMRADVYDIAQFYLVMSILRDHDISIRHWHFRDGGLGLAQSGNCPPAVAAEDCGAGSGQGTSSSLPTLTEGEGDGGGGEGDGEETWPPSDSQGGSGEQGATEFSPFPGGAALGSGTGTGDTAALGSFPNALPGSGSQSQGQFGTPGGNSDQGFRFRLSTPESLRKNDDQSSSWGDAEPTVERVLMMLFDFIGRLQTTLDAGRSPSALLANFEQILARSLVLPIELDEQTRELVSTLIWDVFQNQAEVLPTDERDRPQLKVNPLEFNESANTALIIESNQRLQQVSVGQASHSTTSLPETARPVLRLNSHPDVWRGLSLPLEWNSILLMPPKQQRPNQLRWRAVAYITPKFDDFIFGFVNATVDDDGQLVVPAEDNRVRLDNRPLLTPYQETEFGTRGWLVTLYAILAVCLLGFVMLIRRFATGRRK